MSESEVVDNGESDEIESSEFAAPEDTQAPAQTEVVEPEAASDLPVEAKSEPAAESEPATESAAEPESEPAPAQPIQEPPAAKPEPTTKASVEAESEPAPAEPIQEPPAAKPEPTTKASVEAASEPAPAEPIEESPDSESEPRAAMETEPPSSGADPPPAERRAPATSAEKDASPVETATVEKATSEEATSEEATSEEAGSETSPEEEVKPQGAEPKPKTPAEVIPPIVPHEPVVMQILGGIVTGVSDKEVDLTLDDGRPAVIHRENFDLAGTDPTTVLQVGDGSEGAVLSREDPQNRVVLSRKWVLRDRAWKKAAACVEDHTMMHVKIVSVSKKGVVVDVMGLRGFVPLNHFQLERSEPSADLVGQLVDLRVIAADRQKDKLLLSRRSQLLKDQRKAESAVLQKLKVGSVMQGKVVDLTQFGAFVEIGEEGSRVRGLLHVSEMSWERISSPKGHVTVGEEIDVKVIDVKVKKKRVSLSRKELIEDPLAGIEVGSIHTGTVKRLVDYGVFVDIGPAEGMVHLSELAEYRPGHPSEIVLRGDEVQVKVLKVSRAKRRIELSMRQALYPS